MDDLGVPLFSETSSWWTWLMLLDVDEDVAACWYIYTWSSKQPSFSWMEMVIFQPFFPFVKVFGSSNLKRHKPSQTNGKGAFGRSRSPGFLRKNPVPKFHQSLQHPNLPCHESSVVGYPLVNSHNSGISPFLIGNTSSIRVRVPASYVRWSRSVTPIHPVVAWYAALYFLHCHPQTSAFVRPFVGCQRLHTCHAMKPPGHL